tara:strand:- start:6559 stop:6852 length:294 start_codon:yes stop_codon:yes gene_type:complete
MVLIIFVIVNINVKTLASKDIDSWQDYLELAIENLRVAEKNLKSGLKKEACSYQKKASFYGIKAFINIREQVEEGNLDFSQDEISNNIRIWEELANC